MSRASELAQDDRTQERIGIRFARFGLPAKLFMDGQEQFSYESLYTCKQERSKKKREREEQSNR